MRSMPVCPMIVERLLRPRLTLVALLFLAAIHSLAQVQITTDSGQGALNLPQQIGSSGNSGIGTSPAESERQKAAEQIKNQEKQRVLGVLPQFNVSNISDAVRLS